MGESRAIWAHAIVTVAGIAGLVVVNVWGNESAFLNATFASLVGGGFWGAIQRQKEPVNKE